VKSLAAVALTLVAILLGTVGYAYSGWYDVSASTAHSGPVNWLLSKTSHASIERRGADVMVPDLSDPTLALAGANDFSEMCAGCHGAPGQDPEAMGQGLNPTAPDLAEAAVHLSAGELFWVTKNGVKMTGMPSWGATHDDESIWPVVAFMANVLPELSADDYQEYLAQGAGMGHHSNGDDPAEHDHGEVGHDDGTTSTETGGHEHGGTAHDDEAAAHEHSNVPTPSSETPSSNESAEHDHSAHSHARPDEESKGDTDHQH